MQNAISGFTVPSSMFITSRLIPSRRYGTLYGTSDFGNDTDSLMA